MTDYEYENENAHLVLLIEQAGVVFGIRLNVLPSVPSSRKPDPDKVKTSSEEPTQ